MPGKRALVVIDVQERYVNDRAPIHDQERFLATMRSLIDRARATGTPVVYVQHYRRGESPGQPGVEGIEIHPAIAPIDGEPVVPKGASDSFYASTLDAVLRGLGAQELVVIGLQTEQCIDATCRSALSHGYDVTLVADGHSTWDSPALTARQIIAHHNATLPELAHPDHAIAVLPASAIDFA
jgi:nicotinamidase-related amidase